MLSVAWAWLTTHLAAHKAAYIIPTLVVGVLLGGAGREMIDTRIQSAIDYAMNNHEEEMLATATKVQNDYQAVKIQYAGLEARIDKQDARFLEIEMRELRKQFCTTPRAREAIHTQIERLQSEYIALVGRRYTLPSCEIYG